MADPCLDQACLVALLSNQAAADETRRIETHLNSCAECRRRLEALVAMEGFLPSDVPWAARMDPASPHLLQAIDRVRLNPPGSPRTGVTPPHRAVGLDGVERVYAEASAEVGPWLISVGVPMSVAFDRATSLWSRSLIILLGAVASWLFIALILTNRLADAVGYLDDTAQRIASGDFGPIRPKKMFSLEFAELQTAFGAMLQRFNDASR